MGAFACWLLHGHSAMGDDENFSAVSAMTRQFLGSTTLLHTCQLTKHVFLYICVSMPVLLLIVYLLLFVCVNVGRL